MRLRHRERLEGHRHDILDKTLYKALWNSPISPHYFHGTILKEWLDSAGAAGIPEQRNFGTSRQSVFYLGISFTVGPNPFIEGCQAYGSHAHSLFINFVY